MFRIEPQKYIKCLNCLNNPPRKIGCEECNNLGYGINLSWIIWDKNRQRREERKQEKRNRRKLKSGS